MHQLPHGIRRPFLRTVGACLGSCFGLNLLLFEGSSDEEQHDADHDLQAHNEGPNLDNVEGKALVLQPEYITAADNRALLPSIKGCIDRNRGILPPMQGDEDVDAENNLCEEDDSMQVNTVLAIIDNNEGNLTKEGDLQAGRISNEDEKLQTWYVYEVQFGIQDANYNGVPQFDWALAHVANRVNGTFAKLTAWVMPIPRPRLKMKARLFYMITGMLDPGIRVDHLDALPWDHDGWVSSISFPHHEILPMSIHPIPSSSPFSIHVSLFNAAHDDMTQAPAMPFTPLRGTKGYQAHERQFQVKNLCAGSKPKMKTKMIQMELHYINKDLLDPG